ncbi:FeoB-associated Cys-rich membrane protein [Larkinella soli]|uniref:FeoB-associated Cys-rich membrane protein n=1 Tax=Larkinella soli TaxID=1770527 RepID=UPI000FFC6661|nr:FeoB-associated Cys-rich membrane protein [Larkinella soli]
MLEQIVIGLLFLAALGFLGRRLYRSIFKKEAGCSKGCGCSEDGVVRKTSQSNKASAMS